MCYCILGSKFQHKYYFSLLMFSYNYVLCTLYNVNAYIYVLVSARHRILSILILFFRYKLSNSEKKHVHDEQSIEMVICHCSSVANWFLGSAFFLFFLL